MGLKSTARQLRHKLDLAKAVEVLWLLFSGLQFEAKVITPVPMTAGSSHRVAKGAATDHTVMGEINSGDPACLIRMKPFGAVPPPGNPCWGPDS